MTNFKIMLDYSLHGKLENDCNCNSVDNNSFDFDIEKDEKVKD